MTVRAWILSVILAASASPAYAQNCTIAPASAFRGEQVRLTLAPGTGAKKARVTLQPVSSQPAPPGAASASAPGVAPVEYGQGAPDLDVSDDSDAFTVDPMVPLGRYTVAVTLDGKVPAPCGTLLVALPQNWKMALAEFSPSGTYDVVRHKVGTSESNQEVKTVSLSLRGTGFLTDVHADNRIYINNVRTPIVWGSECPQPASRDPVPSIATLGTVVNSEQIELCNVVVPGVHRVVTVEVSQEGAPRSAARYFRLYWWDRKMVGTVAAIVAMLLAAAVLYLIHVFKSSQTVEQPLGLWQILFLDPETDTYSLSKLQFYMWTFAALFGYVYLAISRLFIQGERWPDIPDGLPAVIALGAGTAVGAQIVQSTKGPKGAGSERPNLGDFITSGGVAAPERVQMLVWTIVGVGVFLYAVLSHGPEEIRTLDPVPTGLLYMMGLSSLGYLGGKLARAAGPVINELSIVPAESDQTLQGEGQPSLPDLTVARTHAEQASARLAVKGGAAAKPALDALSAGVTAVKGATTLGAMRALLVTLTGEVAKAEAAAASAAAALAQPTPPADAVHAAQTAQGAAAALQDLAAAVTAAVGALPTSPVRREFTRVIELRGRNLSDQALFSIDQAELPFRMLRPNPDGKQLPEMVIREKNDPNLGVVIRLTIDPTRLEEPDLRQYHRWFGQPSQGPRTFSIINLDGQRSDISFSIPPATAQKPTDTAGQNR